MKKGLIFSVLLLFLFLFVCGNASAWQGRMAGMDDPYGLVADESDFLIHPARIVNGEETRYYGHYRFTYTDVNDWDWRNELDSAFGSPAPSGFFTRKHDADGHKYLHEALVGFSTSLGSGRMGLFFEYTGEFTDLDINGRLSLDGDPLDVDDDIDNDLNDFALRFIHGIPVGDGRLGWEAKIAYRNEEHQDKRTIEDSIEFENIFGPYRYQLPYDSSYWEASLKAGVQLKSDAIQTDLTAHGGIIFAGDNERDISIDGESLNLDGDVDGWHLGADFWLRFLSSEQTSFPFVFSVNYQTKERDADDTFDLGDPASMDNEITETSMVITVGGGVDHKTSDESRIAAGVYYNFIQIEDAMDTFFSFMIPDNGPLPLTIGLWESDEYPKYTEHQIMLKLAGEKAVSSAWTLLGGLNAYYGFVDKEYKSDLISHLITEDAELDGYHWGINGAIGFSANFENVTIEPFFTMGYRELDLDGNRDWDASALELAGLDIKEEINEWFFSVGCSISF